MVEGEPVGETEGEVVGVEVLGANEGDEEGTPVVGDTDGANVDGDNVGETVVGDRVGDNVGKWVGGRGELVGPVVIGKHKNRCSIRLFNVLKSSVS